jgi:glycosyltransferase involved in cell wall biosynthesis
MKRVVYDSQVFAEQAHGGVSRYFVTLADRLSQLTTWRPLLALGIHIKSPQLEQQLERYGIRLSVPALAHTFRLKQTANSFLMRAYRPELDGRTLYHPTWYHAPTIRAWAHLPLVVTIHDLIPETLPEITTPTQLRDRREALERARAIICVSNSTLNKLSRHYPWAVDRATVIRLGVTALPPARSHSETAQDYFIHIGKRGSYKDFSTVVRALKHAPAKTGLIAVGGGGMSTWEEKLLEAGELANRVIFRGNISDQTLSNLIAGSRGLISASREEGFGLPALETLMAGRPVILSDIDVYRELYGPWATFFPPGDSESLGKAMADVLHSPLAGPSKEELAATYSWDETARRTADVYDKVID